MLVDVTHYAESIKYWLLWYNFKGEISFLSMYILYVGFNWVVSLKQIFPISIFECVFTSLKIPSVVDLYTAWAVAQRTTKLARLTRLT
jgi:hypothetical protein